MKHIYGLFFWILIMFAAVDAFAAETYTGTTTLRCTIVVSDVNGNPADPLGARFYADGRLVADVDFTAAPPEGPTCAASIDIPPGTYDFTVAMYNDIGEGVQSLPTNFTVRVPRGVPEQAEPPTVEVGDLADLGPPDREYFALTPSRDSIHPGVPAGTRVRVWDLAGGVEVTFRGSTRGVEAPYRLAWAYETQTGWTEPQEIVWN